MPVSVLAKQERQDSSTAFTSDKEGHGVGAFDDEPIRGGPATSIIGSILFVIPTMSVFVSHLKKLI